MNSLISFVNNYFANYTPFRLIAGSVGSTVLAYLAYKIFTTPIEELKGSVIKNLISIAKKVPGTSSIVEKERQKTIDKLRKDVLRDLGVEDFLEIPEEPLPKEQIFKMMEHFKVKEDPKWKEGKVSGAVYYGDDVFTEFLNQVYSLYSTSNALHPDIWPSLRKFESEIVRMGIKMLNGGKECCGAITSGGTESILMAIKAARDYGQKVRGIDYPEMIIPITAHAAFEKGAQYFKIKLIKIPTCDDFRVDVAKMRKAITKNTILLVGSAPNYPHGTIDDIESIAAMASERDIPCHVDGCLGGFILPWISKIKGSQIPLFDFRVKGVTSISADTHKYGYTQKGTSLILFSDKKYRRHMYFISTDWPGGLYASPSIPGSRPGGLIAVAWAAMLNIGKKGYMEVAESIYSCFLKLKSGIPKIKGLQLMGDPLAFVIAFTSPDFNIYSVSDAMTKKGWSLNPIHRPSGVHICITKKTVGKEELFLNDLQECVEMVRNNPHLAKEGNAPIYGLAASFPDRTAIRDIVVDYLDISLETPEDSKN